MCIECMPRMCSYTGTKRRHQIDTLELSGVTDSRKLFSMSARNKLKSSAKGNSLNH